MKNFKIAKKLLVTFGVILLLFCITVAVSLYSLITTGGSFTLFYTNPFVVTNRASDMQTGIKAMAADIGYAMMSTDREESAGFIESARNELQALEEDIAFMKTEFTGDQTLIQNYEQTMAGIAADRDRVLQMAGNNQNEEAAALYLEKVMPQLVLAQDYLKEIDTASENAAKAEYESSEQRQGVVTAVLITLSAAAFGITVLLAAYITRGLSRPIQEIKSAADQMAEGHLDVSVRYTSRDELGGLADSMRKMSQRISFYMGEISSGIGQMAEGDLCVTARENFRGDFLEPQMAIRKLILYLNDTLLQINESSGQVSSGAEQVSSGAQALSQGTTEQASAVEELAATMEEISKEVGQNAETAEAVKSSVQEIGSKVEVSNRDMQEMMDAMKEISESSSQIGKVIKTIEDIAFQTNILALNAAVEAARAGAAGRGFAVVADEVRSLAAKSSEASKDTAALIEHSQNSVSHGTKIAEETAEALHSVVEGTKDITVKVNQIAEASVKQADAAVQIAQGVEQISSVVQTNSATAEQSAAASEELSGQAEVLKHLVQQFTLREKEESGTALPLKSEESGYSMAGQDKY